MITIKEVKCKRDFIDFVKFPFELYQDNSFWVPPIISDEILSFNPENDIFKTVDAHFFLAYKNNKIVGRIVAIINWTEVNELHKRKIRFGWLDMIDDIEVTYLLLKKVEEIGIKNNLDYIEGPMGFSNMDKAGLLTFGFQEIATMIGLYNHSYYVNHLEKLNFIPEASWIEFKFELKNIPIHKIENIAKAIENRYHVRSLKFKKSSEIIPYVNEMFNLLNKTYADLQSFVPIQPFQIEHYKTKYIKYIRPEFISIVMDENEKIIAFAITMPSMSKAFQKAKGSLFPFGFWHLYQATQKNNQVEFYLIGVDPEFQNKGIAALIFRDFYHSFKNNNIRTCETNPQLEENKKVQQLWRNFFPEIHKKRSTFKINLGHLNQKNHL